MPQPASPSVPHDDLWTLGYVSVAVRPPSPEDLAHILHAAQDANPRHGVTGLLLHCDGSFMQVLEGPRAGVTEIYRRIAASPLHTGLVVLFEQPIAVREFGDWAMACQQAAPAALDDVVRAPKGTSRRMLSQYWLAWR